MSKFSSRLKNSNNFLFFNSSNTRIENISYILHKWSTTELISFFWAKDSQSNIPIKINDSLCHIFYCKRQNWLVENEKAVKDDFPLAPNVPCPNN